MSSQQKFHEDSNFKFPHFCLTQVIVLLVLETITTILYYRLSDKFQWAFFLLPVILVYFSILFVAAWSRDWYNHFHRFIISLCGYTILLPILIIVYYFVWNPTLSLKWIKSTNCNILGNFYTKIGGLENYSLQYISVDNDLIGISCISDGQNHGTHMKGFQFYHYGDLVSCDDNYISEQSQKHEDESDNNYSICKSTYTFSGVKIPTWLCSKQQDYSHIKKEHQTSQNCYYSIYGDEMKARQNGKSTITSSGAALKDQIDIFIVRLDSQVYFFQEGFMCLVIFLFFPSIIFMFQLPSGYLASYFILYFCAFSIEQENKAFAELEKLAQKNKDAIQQMADKPQETSESERKRQRIEPEEINQILSPNSQLKDRDFYDIYNQTRKRQIGNNRQAAVSITIEDDSIIDHTNQNINNTNNDFTKMDLIPKDHLNNAQSMEEIEDQKLANQQNQQPFVEESENDFNSSYMKIRQIYKRKLDPKYQKEVLKKKKEGITIENEEIKVIKEIQEGMNSLAGKQKLIFEQKQVITDKQIEGEIKKEEINNKLIDTDNQQDNSIEKTDESAKLSIKDTQIQELQNLQPN